MKLPIIVLALLLSISLPAQVDTSITLSKTVTRCSFKVTQISFQLPPITSLPMPAYSYQQGRLPMFCAMEDRFWRKTGFDFRLRIADRLPGR